MTCLHYFHRFSAVVLLIMTFGVASNAQNSFEGKIDYAISYEELPAEVAPMESMLPKEMVFHIKGNKIALVQGMMGGSQTVVSNTETNESFILMDMMGQKLAIVMTEAEIAAAAKELGDINIAYLEGTKEIAGYTCKKATVTNEGAAIEVWYTEEIIGAMHSEFKTLNGFPLEYYSFQEGMKMKISATNVAKGPQPDNLFSVPEGYRKMTMDEFSAAMRSGGNY